jgi:glycosyltransferase involved in cell wall biosynthesis
MHILYIVGEFPSATEYFILNEITALRQEDYWITVVSLSPIPGRRKGAMDMDTGEIFHDRKITMNKLLTGCLFLLREPSVFIGLFKKAHFFGQKNRLRTLKDMLSGLYLYQNLKGLKIRRIHAHFATRPADIGYILACLFDLPLSISAHANDIYVHPEKIKRKVTFSEFIVTCTQYNQRFLSSLCGPALADRIHLIYHGLDPGKWPFKAMPGSVGLEGSADPVGLTDPGPPLSILTIGRFIEKKGISDLLEACLFLSRKKIPYRLTIIGEGPLREKYKSFCEQHDLEHWVTFLDLTPQQELLAQYHRADIFVLPCKIAENGDRDGIPNVLLEAMAAGVPVISTSVSAIPEVITHETTGLLVREGDPLQLAAEIERLYMDRPLQEKLKWNARTMIEQCMTINEATGKLMALFEKNATQN